MAARSTCATTSHRPEVGDKQLCPRSLGTSNTKQSYIDHTWASEKERKKMAGDALDQERTFPCSVV